MKIPQFSALTKESSARASRATCIIGTRQAGLCKYSPRLPHSGISLSRGKKNKNDKRETQTWKLAGYVFVYHLGI